MLVCFKTRAITIILINIRKLNSYLSHSMIDSIPRILKKIKIQTSFVSLVVPKALSNRTGISFYDFYFIIRGNLYDAIHDFYGLEPVIIQRI